jgi:hypothetical protein
MTMVNIGDRPCHHHCGEWTDLWASHTALTTHITNADHDELSIEFHNEHSVGGTITIDLRDSASTTSILGFPDQVQVPAFHTAPGLQPTTVVRHYSPLGTRDLYVDLTLAAANAGGLNVWFRICT